MRIKNFMLKYAVLCIFSFVAVEFLASRIISFTCVRTNLNELKPNALNVKRVNSSVLLDSIKRRTYFTLPPKQPAELCVQTEKRSLRLSRDVLDRVFDEGFGVRDSSLVGEDIELEPGDVPTVAHYVWCGSKMFMFEDYLGLLSVVRVAKPLKIVFHYNSVPSDPTRYHTWFEEMSQSLPNLVMQHTDRVLGCNSTDALDYALEQLAASSHGGLYFGERAVLTYVPAHWKVVDRITYALPGARSSEQKIVFVRTGITDKDTTLEKFKSDVINASYECLSAEKFNEAMRSSLKSESISPCLALTGPLYPENILNDSSPFGKVARMLYYGKSDNLNAVQTQNPDEVIPSISHFITLDGEDNKVVNWTFSNYASILSALYIGGFQRVYVHGNQIPSGEWWDRLSQENVRFIRIDRADTVFMNRVKVLAHQSDILRSYILLKYGGVYQDKDVFWTSPPPDHVMRYPAVICYDWPWYDVWPRSINLGIMMARRGSTFLRRFLDHLWYHEDSSWGFNGIMMPYKIYERHPDTAYIYTRLQ
ncbi:hypothetical protein Bpfe_024927, partial [Biomphalaria pfeifferi]